EVSAERAGVEGEPVGAVGFAPEPKRGDQGGADGSEQERVREVPVKLDGEERIGGAADKHVGIGNESGESADGSGGAAEFSTERDIPEARAEKSVGEWIHAFASNA